MVCMGIQVEDYYSTIVLPFMKNHFVAGFPRDTQQQHQLYLWATAVVSAYSFTLGEDKFQAMVSNCSSLCLYAQHSARSA